MFLTLGKVINHVLRLADRVGVEEAAGHCKSSCLTVPLVGLIVTARRWAGTVHGDIDSNGRR